MLLEILSLIVGLKCAVYCFSFQKLSVNSNALGAIPGSCLVTGVKSIRRRITVPGMILVSFSGNDNVSPTTAKYPQQSVHNKVSIKVILWSLDFQSDQDALYYNSCLLITHTTQHHEFPFDNENPFIINQYLRTDENSFFHRDDHVYGFYPFLTEDVA